MWELVSVGEYFIKSPWSRSSKKFYLGDRLGYLWQTIFFHYLGFSKHVVNLPGERNFSQSSSDLVLDK